MIINSFSPGSIATSVWAQAARTLTADPATDAGAATLVWTHATRTVTSLAAAYTNISAAAASLGAGLVLDNRPAAGKFRENNFQSGSASMVVGTYNGTTFNQYATNTAQNFPTMMPSTPTVCTTIKNSSAGSLTYDLAGWDIG